MKEAIKWTISQYFDSILNRKMQGFESCMPRTSSYTVTWKTWTAGWTCQNKRMSWFCTHSSTNTNTSSITTEKSQNAFQQLTDLSATVFLLDKATRKCSIIKLLKSFKFNLICLPFTSKLKDKNTQCIKILRKHTSITNINPLHIFCEKQIVKWHSNGSVYIA